jgi:hypothetical protein
MKFRESFLRIKPTVLKILETYPETRDNDILLMITIWDLQSKLESFGEFKRLLLDGYLAIPQSIVRARQKIQEENIHLRGLSYERRKKIELEISNQIKINFEQ